MSDPTPAPPGGTTAAGIEVVRGRGHDRLGGPGTRPGPPHPRTAGRLPEEFPVPTGREEQWRFTPLDRLGGLHEAPAEPEGKVLVHVDAPDPVVVAEVDREDPRVGAVVEPVDRVAALALAGAATVTLVQVPAQAELSRPVSLTVQADAGRSYGHVCLVAGEHSRATVVLDHRGAGAYAGLVEVDLRAGAELTLVCVQDWDATAVHVAQHAALVGRDARLRLVEVTLGGDLVRVSPTVRFAGPGGDAELLGLFFADAGQHLEHRLFVSHDVPSCRSRVVYKGAVQGDGAHTVWVGDVFIGPEAVGTDTYELNRNLLLSEGARADSVPNLEITTGDVARAGHASATGRFDDEQLFYLMSRGIPTDEARRLVVRGFFADVLAQVGVAELEERLSAAIDAELLTGRR